MSKKDGDEGRALLVGIALKIAFLFCMSGVVGLAVSALSRSMAVAVVAFGLIGVGATIAIGAAAWWWMCAIIDDTKKFITKLREVKADRAYANMKALGASPQECAEARNHVLGIVPKFKPIPEEDEGEDDEPVVRKKSIGTKANW